LGPADHGLVAVGDAPVAHRRGRGQPRRVSVRSVTVPGRVQGWRLHERLVADSPTSCWLDSSAGERDGPAAAAAARYSVIGDGSGPLAVELSHRVGVGTTVRDSEGERLRPGHFLSTVQDLLESFEVSDADLPVPFRPGLVGYLGSELRAETAPGDPGAPRYDAPHPDAWMLLVDRAVVLD